MLLKSRARPLILATLLTVSDSETGFVEARINLYYLKVIRTVEKYFSHNHLWINQCIPLFVFWGKLQISALGIYKDSSVCGIFC